MGASKREIERIEDLNTVARGIAKEVGIIEEAYDFTPCYITDDTTDAKDLATELWNKKDSRISGFETVEILHATIDDVIQEMPDLDDYNDGLMNKE